MPKTPAEALAAHVARPAAASTAARTRTLGSTIGNNGAAPAGQPKPIDALGTKTWAAPQRTTISTVGTNGAVPAGQPKPLTPKEAGVRRASWTGYTATAPQVGL